ncbi:uncharacterized mitochondrial protein AtMg00810-like [Miscanthus floridulus]|uniref:uncharacterized mitochondrial protein AtMg00810-like n=1 Tax=Miscanthus floridulus TaxID=154761 RepID=UPI00345AAD35
MGFTASMSDASLFVHKDSDRVAYLLLYVDNIILMASSRELLQLITARLHSEFAMTDLGDLHHFLGISMTRYSLGYSCRSPHLVLIKRILRYIKGSLSAGLHLGTEPVDQLTAYSDANWAGCPDTRRSTSGFCIFLGDNLVSWSAKQQNNVSCSSAEAEYRDVAHAVAECCWLCQLLQVLHLPLPSATVVFYDNVSVVYMTANPVHH